MGRERDSETERVKAASNSLTHPSILVYSRGCCNVFKDLSGSRMSSTPVKGAAWFSRLLQVIKTCTTKFLSFERSLEVNE